MSFLGHFEPFLVLFGPFYVIWVHLGGNFGSFLAILDNLGPYWSFKKKVRLEACPPGGLEKCPPGGMSTWRTKKSPSWISSFFTGEMSGWRNVLLEACPPGGLESCPPQGHLATGEMSSWRHVPLEACPLGGMSPWRHVPLEACPP